MKARQEDSAVCRLNMRIRYARSPDGSLDLPLCDLGASATRAGLCGHITSATVQGMINALHTIALYVRDQDQSKRFYVEDLGFECQEDQETPGGRFGRPSRRRSGLEPSST